jgi:coenzyme F420-reducing hydrogenase delta subunit
MHKAVKFETQNPKTEAPAAWSPRIIDFICNWCTITSEELAGASEVKMGSRVRAVRLSCSSRIDPLFIVKAFENGADGVIVGGCPISDCHYSPGEDHARKLFSVLHDLLAIQGVEEERVTFSPVSASDGDKWQEVVRQTTEKIRRLGPLERGGKTEALLH